MVQKKETDLHDPKSIIKTMLSYEGTQMAMTQQDSWMEMDNSNLLINRKLNRRRGNAEIIHLQWIYRKILYVNMGVKEGSSK